MLLSTTGKRLIGLVLAVLMGVALMPMIDQNSVAFAKSKKLGKVGNVSVSVAGDKAAIRWGQVSNAKKYQVQIQVRKGSKWKKARYAKVGQTAYSYKIAKNKKYRVRVRALAKKKGAWSGWKSFAAGKVTKPSAQPDAAPAPGAEEGENVETPAPGTEDPEDVETPVPDTEEPKELALPAPATLTAISITNTSMRLNWSAVENCASYTIEKKNNSTGTFTVVKSGLTATSRNITGLEKNTQYTFRVKAVSSSGMEGVSITKTFSTANVSLDEGPKVGTYTISKGDNESALNNFKIDGITPEDETFLGLVDDGSTLIFSEDNYDWVSMSDNYLRKKDGKVYQLKSIRSSDYTIFYTSSKNKFGLTTKGEAVLTATLVNTKDKTDILIYHFNAINNHENENYKNYKKFKDDWIRDNITSDMTIYQKVYKVGYFVGYSYKYVADGSTTGEGLYRNRSGNCWGYTKQAIELCRDMGIECVTISPTKEDEILHRDVMFVDETGDIYVMYCTAGFSIKKYESAEKLRKDYTCNNVVAFTRRPHDEFKNSFEDFGL